ncbi:hypothetical protein EX895_001424 [Sporisorium graminicola]|uniref:Spt20-like SEP domain-containing protein n=1 Tax=Sporisorium graminicola TaxID=280036 RepID=A0A4V6EU92_9BASI|nr:hypothetical protein EX895_001424 [Sporisorium graminicola]TKY89639.1 hypothetical protein EX895_001424 [Sporisorium graminicola]
MATTASVYNTSRTTRQILRRHRKDKPSLILHLHNHHFRFERQNGMFLFDSPVKAFLGYIRDQKVPADLIDVLTESGIQFFEGCLLVDVHDHRSHAAASSSVLGPRELHNMSAAGAIARAGPDGASGSIGEGGLASSLFYLQEGGRYGARKLLGATGSTDPRTGGLGGVEIYRIVLHPTSETLWADIKMLDDMTGGMWSDQEALEVEAKILALTAPPLCLTPDPQATRIANLMLSSTALPSAYNPSQDSPFRSAKKRGANSIEMEKEEANRQRREKIMRLMQHGHKSAVPPQAGLQSALARPGGAAMGESAGSTSAAAATAFVPTFDRMSFIERWRIGRNAALNGGLPGVLPPGGGAANAPNGTAAPGANTKGGKDATKASDKDDSTDAANTSTAKKPPSKKKKKAQREKEEAEAAAAAEAAKKKAEEEAAAAAAASKKPKKKLTKKEREEKERKEKEEKEKAEKEEKERKEKEAAAAAAANGKPSKPKSKKKQKEEAAAAASAETAHKSPAKSAKADAPGSPEKDKKASPKKTAAKKPATTAAATATPTTTAVTPASTGKKKTPAKSDKKNNAAANAGATNGTADFTPSAAAVQGTPILNSATPSVQSTPTPAHRSIPSQPQQAQQLQQQQQQMQQPFTQQQLQQAALAGMFPNMANQLPFGAAAPNAGAQGGSGFGMPMMNGFPPTSNPQATAAALAAMQGMGLGQFGGGGFNNAAQMQQMMSMMNAGGMVGFNGMPGFGGQQVGQGGQPVQQQGQPGVQQQGQQGQGQGQGGDMPVGVGLAGLANWGTGK